MRKLQRQHWSAVAARSSDCRFPVMEIARLKSLCTAIDSRAFDSAYPIKTHTKAGGGCPNRTQPSEASTGSPARHHKAGKVEMPQRTATTQETVTLPARAAPVLRKAVANRSTLSGTGVAGQYWQHNGTTTTNVAANGTTQMQIVTTPSAVPEPSTFLLLGPTFAAGCLFLRRRTRGLSPAQRSV